MCYRQIHRCPSMMPKKPVLIEQTWPTYSVVSSSSDYPAHLLTDVYNWHVKYFFLLLQTNKGNLTVCLWMIWGG